MDTRILIIDDDRHLLASLRSTLRQYYEVDTARSRRSAREKLSDHAYECVLLDLGLGGTDGSEICRWLRQRQDHVPIIVLTADDFDVSKARLLDAGADDYLTKPASIIELRARIDAVVRRNRFAPARSSTVEAGGVTLDSVQRTVFRDGREVTLRDKEFKLLERLMYRAEANTSLAQLKKSGWGNEEVSSATLRTQISNLRNRIDKPFDRPLIRTIFPVGYRFTTRPVRSRKGGR